MSGCSAWPPGPAHLRCAGEGVAIRSRLPSRSVRIRRPDGRRQALTSLPRP